MFITCLWVGVCACAPNHLPEPTQKHTSRESLALVVPTDAEEVQEALERLRRVRACLVATRAGARVAREFMLSLV